MALSVNVQTELWGGASNEMKGWALERKGHKKSWVI